MSRRSDLRAVLVDLVGRCEWPGCQETTRLELAHLQSVGMGGRPSADRLDNVALLCHRHARYSDGLYLADGRAGYLEAHELLLGASWPLAELAGNLAYERARALREHVLASRPGLEREGGYSHAGRDPW